VTWSSSSGKQKQKQKRAANDAVSEPTKDIIDNFGNTGTANVANFGSNQSN
jgi:hypothetical protein